MSLLFIYSFLTMSISSICLLIEFETRLIILVESLYKISFPYWETRAINAKPNRLFLPNIQ